MDIYVVAVCNYDHELIVGYFTDKQLAVQYCELHNDDNEYYNDMKYYVKTVQLLD